MRRKQVKQDKNNRYLAPLLLCSFILLSITIIFSLGSNSPSGESNVKTLKTQLITGDKNTTYEELDLPHEIQPQILLEEQLYSLLHKKKIPLENVDISKKNGGTGYTETCWKIKTAQTPLALISSIKKIFRQANHQMLNEGNRPNKGYFITYKKDDNRFTVELLTHSTVKQITVKARNNKGKPQVAIIIDDIGQEMEVFTEIVNLNAPITVSVLPGRRFTEISAEIANQHGLQVMLHQPMEPRRTSLFPRETGIIDNGMSVEKIKSTLTDNLSEIPHLAGVNNHMGSLTTSQKKAMQTVMQQLKKHNVFFVDSLTTGRSIAYKTALECGVAAAKRDIFIDSSGGYNFAVRQIKRLIIVAKRKGNAIGIGHPKMTTVRALRKMLPEIKKGGIELVEASRITR